jgi:hypothetical protein
MPERIETVSSARLMRRCPSESNPHCDSPLLFFPKSADFRDGLIWPLCALANVVTSKPLKASITRLASASTFKISCVISLTVTRCPSSNTLCTLFVFRVSWANPRLPGNEDGGAASFLMLPAGLAVGEIGVSSFPRLAGALEDTDIVSA